MVIVRQIPNHKIVGSSHAEATWLNKYHPAWATGDNNGASVHSAANEYPAIDRDGNCTWVTHGALECVRGVYTPQGVEQVTDVTGLPGVIPKYLETHFNTIYHYFDYDNI